MRITIFDFDDTLFYTTAFTKCPEIELERYDEHIQKTLEIAKSYSDVVFIITNAHIGWLFEICLKQFPKLSQYIYRNIIVVSTVNEGFSSENKPVEKWKIDAFEKIIGRLLEKDSNIHHLITFGDAPHDKLASEYIMNKYNNVIVKHISFVIQPTIHDLFLQHVVVQKDFPNYCSMEKNIYDSFQ